MKAVPGARETSEAPDESRRIRQAELLISYVLRGGVLVSAGVIVVGVVLFYARYLAGDVGLDATLVPRSLGDVAQGLGQGNPLAIIAVGLLILLATPTIRVAVSIITFVLTRDWLYTVITIIVLAILLLSFALGRGGA